MGAGSSKSAKSKLTTDELETARRALDTVASLEQRMTFLEVSLREKEAKPGVGKPHALNDAEYFREEKIKRAKASGPATAAMSMTAVLPVVRPALIALRTSVNVALSQVALPEVHAPTSPHVRAGAPTALEWWRPLPGVASGMRADGGNALSCLLT